MGFFRFEQGLGPALLFGAEPLGATGLRPGHAPILAESEKCAAGAIGKHLIL
jgi:hypothetical protein